MGSAAIGAAFSGEHVSISGGDHSRGSNRHLISFAHGISRANGAVTRSIYRNMEHGHGT